VSNSFLQAPLTFNTPIRWNLNAKPPPISNFDLEAIYSYEAELENQATDEDGTSHDTGKDGWFQEQDGISMYTVPSTMNNKRIDAILSSLQPELSRSQWGSCVADGKVAIVVNGQTTVITRKSHKLMQGDIIYARQKDEEKPTDIVPEDLPLDILYEDEHMIILNKAAGMVVHPAAGNWNGTVVNALAYYLAYKSPFGSGEFIGDDGTVNTEEGKLDDDGETIAFRPGIVHRLDKGTTGVLVVAKTKASLAALSEAFAKRTLKKTYIAITVGNPGKRVVINKPIGRHPLYRQKMRVVPNPGKMGNNQVVSYQPVQQLPEKGKSAAQIGRNALSYVDTRAFDGKISVAQVRIETGRTHQIRVHLQDRGTPVYGDDVYGLKDWNKRLSKTHKIERPLLHAFRLELHHPISGEKMVIRAPLAEDMKQVTTAIWPQGHTEMADLFQ